MELASYSTILEAKSVASGDMAWIEAALPEKGVSTGLAPLSAFIC
ncbi:MAG: hypothetical protein RLZZ245_3634 [Verrucomicrobiota bacterium]